MSTTDIIITVVLSVASFISMIVGGLSHYILSGLSNRIKDLEKFKMTITADVNQANQRAIRAETLLQERLDDIREIKEEIIGMRDSIEELKNILTKWSYHF